MLLSKPSIAHALVSSKDQMEKQYSDLKLQASPRKGPKGEYGPKERERLKNLAKFHDLADSIVYDSLKKIMVFKVYRHIKQGNFTLHSKSQTLDSKFDCTVKFKIYITRMND